MSSVNSLTHERVNDFFRKQAFIPQFFIKGKVKKRQSSNCEQNTQILHILRLFFRSLDHWKRINNRLNWAQHIFRAQEITINTGELNEFEQSFEKRHEI